MKPEVQPLSACLELHRKNVEHKMADLSHASEGQLIDLLADLSGWIIRKPHKLALARAAMWFVHAEYCRRRIPPRFRETLPPVPWSPKTLAQRVIKADAPYLDLQWLVTRYPDQRLSGKWAALITLSANDPDPGYWTPYASTPEEALSIGELLVNRSDHLPGKCKTLHLTEAQQVGMRYFCSLKIRTKYKELVKDIPEIKRKLRQLKIKQLTSDRIERRTQYWLAWKLAGGGQHWQASADIYNVITGESVTRQGMRDMINRMIAMKVARTKKVRKLTT